MGKLRLPIAPRYIGLFWMSILATLMGVAYSPIGNIPHTLPLGLDVIVALLPQATAGWNPIWVYGVLWLIVGVGGLLTVLLRKRGAAVFGIQVGLYTTWFLGYGMAFLLGDPRAWVTAGYFLVAAGATWSLTRVDPPLRILWRKVSLWKRS